MALLSPTVLEIFTKFHLRDLGPLDSRPRVTSTNTGYHHLIDRPDLVGIALGMELLYLTVLEIFTNFHVRDL